MVSFHKYKNSSYICSMQLKKYQIAKIIDYFKTKPVLKAYLFGSYATDSATEKSDVDVLVELDYSQRIGFQFVQMKLDLEKMLGKQVDLVSTNAVSKYIKPHIESEKIEIYAK
ncbi:MAG: nucleotidyltransferase domain-containing protein [Flavobacterium sp.]|nr:nucleotidyltransferase domain-containing protein [Flavobacterium sp.]